MSTALLVFVGAVVIAATGWWLVGKFGSGPLEPVVVSDYEPVDVNVDVHAAQSVSFDTAVRGYHMAQVDAVVTQLLDVIRTQDAQLQTLRLSAGEHSPGTQDSAEQRSADRGSIAQGSSENGSAEVAEEVHGSTD